MNRAESADEKNINETLLDTAATFAKDARADTVLLFIDALDKRELWRRFPRKKDLVLVTRKTDQDNERAKKLKALRKEVRAVIELPGVKLTRMSQIKLSTIMCLTEGVINNSDRILCITGLPGSGVLDTVLLLDLEKESEILTTRDIAKGLLRRIKPEVLETVLNLAIDLASEGREGRTVGTTFVVGDHEKVMKLAKPLIMNPFKGYPEDVRNIIDDSVHETIKEFALLDGAFIIREDGVVMSAGSHLEAALENKDLLPGLGSRHMAAAGITDLTDAVAITISGSTGIVRIFSKGRILMEIERPTLNPEGS